MKRDFLKNFKVGDQMLPDEIVDAIMAENGRDIEAAKRPFADYDTIKNQLSEAQKTINVKSNRRFRLVSIAVNRNLRLPQRSGAVNLLLITSSLSA